MVLKTKRCRFSGAKICPGRGIRFIRSDSQVFLFVNSKCKHYLHNKLKPSKLTWTTIYQNQHKKDIAEEVIQKKRTERPEAQDGSREAAHFEIKERIKKIKDEKKVKKAELQTKSQKAGGKGNMSK
ncbi:hypothetical protein R3W88_019331 [Solanum pinnatisectum]|uniref:Large ribosomal subunit protein eL24-related N-terminal domain-containing protein n=1 Tax=Solanum pinnatisectum TaxID=50273 RepID=A0AAV9KJC8_9SOLN|nr:hypothetical protein R3W88_019331 [Solanum pinnatisectum]